MLIAFIWVLFPVFPCINILRYTQIHMNRLTHVLCFSQHFLKNPMLTQIHSRFVYHNYNDTFYSVSLPLNYRIFGINIYFVFYRVYCEMVNCCFLLLLLLHDIGILELYQCIDAFIYIFLCVSFGFVYCDS